MTMAVAAEELAGFSVLLVEDDPIMRVSLEDRLRLEGFPTIGVTTLAEARRHLVHGHVDLVITDIRLPDGTGQELFHEVSAACPGLPVMLMTAFGSVADAVDLVKAGAVDYLTKPFKADALIASVRRILGGPAPGGQPAQGVGILGHSIAMRGVERLVARVAPLDSSVLITGESGVGKEVVANLIHQGSVRKDKPFIKVNCAAIPFNLVESELFGHEKGAFTGADRRRLGRFEQAQGGTIFLDEIAEIPPETQVKLLRVIQERVIERVGGNQPVPLDVRILAATQVDLQQAMEAGKFRGDLFWRLNVIRVEIPPLRERPDDIPVLARRFVDSQAKAMGKRVWGVSPEAERRLQQLAFAGNVRELKNLIERAVALCDGNRIETHDLFPASLECREPLPRDDYPSLKAAVEETEQETIRNTLARCNGAVGVAAEQLGISRKCLWEKMRRYGIARDQDDA